MRPTFLTVLIGLAALIIYACNQVDDHGATFLIRHAHVIDLEDGSLEEDQRVFIKDNLIVQVEPDDATEFAAIPNQLDAQGQFLLPGLWDMHVHLCWETALDSLFAQAFLQYGITGVRDMGGSLEVLNAYRERIKEQPIHGPNIVGCGPFLDGNPPLQFGFSVPIDQRVEVEGVLDSLVQAGSDFFKVYSLLSEESLQAIARAATKLDRPFAGHLSELIDPVAAIESGMASVEHLNRLEDFWPADSIQLEEIASLMGAQPTYLCPTLVVYHRKAWMNERDAITRPIDEGFIPPILRQEWRTGRRARLQNYPAREDWIKLKERFLEQQQLVLYLHQLGVPLLAGSDFAGMPYVYPGYGLHEELQLLVSAGLSPLAALQSATIRPVEYLGIADQFGSVAPGKVADLLLLKRNPLEDISHTLSIREVLREGRLISKW